MMKQVFKRTDGLKDKEFHYCGGCLHSVVHRLIGEALEEMGLLDCSIGICPVGCAVFMYGYAKSIGKVSGTPDTSVLDKYADASSIAPYAKEAVAWLVSSGLMTGRSETSIAPLAESTRAEISAFAVNCLEFLAK